MEDRGRYLRSSRACWPIGARCRTCSTASTVAVDVPRIGKEEATQKAHKEATEEASQKAWQKASEEEAQAEAQTST